MFKSPSPQYIAPPSIGEAPQTPTPPPVLGQQAPSKSTKRKPQQTILGSSGLSGQANTGQKTLLGQ